MPLEDVLADHARVRRLTATGPLVEGERDVAFVDGPAFACLLTLPGGAEQADPSGRRVVRSPTLLCAATAVDGSRVALRAGDELLIESTATNIAEGAPTGTFARWQLDGQPQPMVRPGEAPFGFNATVKRVED